MQRRLTARGVERRDQLLAAAARCFADRGYDRTSVAGICAGCGVGKGVFYWYFPSKEALFDAVLDDAVTSLRKAQRKAIEDEDDPVTRIVRGIRATLEHLADDDVSFRLFEFAAVDTTFAAAYRAGVEIAVEDTARHLKEAMAAGLIPDGDPYLLGRGITTITMDFSRRFLAPGWADMPTDAARRSAAVEEVVDAAVRFCLHGIGAP
jgi:TetR/AcrR family transcriptional repressor of mexJK operon